MKISRPMFNALDTHLSSESGILIGRRDVLDALVRRGLATIGTFTVGQYTNTRCYRITDAGKDAARNSIRPAYRKRVR